MKKILLILCFLFSIKSIACSCYVPSVGEKYLNSEVIAKVKILKIYKNVDNYNHYKADILIKKIYKGIEIKSIYIRGDNNDEDERYKNSCDIFIPEGAELLIYTSKNERGEYTLRMCSGYLTLNTTLKRKKELNKLELKIKTEKNNVYK